MGDVSKNINKGGKIKDLNELVSMVVQRRSIVLVNKDHPLIVQLKPAAFLINWPLRDILKWNLHYAIRDSEIQEVEFEE